MSCHWKNLGTVVSLISIKILCIFTFQIAPDLKVYSYFQVYTSDNLIADIGGYLGLFLGLSVFSLFEIIEAILEKIKTNDEKKNNNKKAADLEMNIQWTPLVNITKILQSQI